MDLVSIIIPCYNPGPYLLEAIASARGQSYSNIETILVNDGGDRKESRDIVTEAAGKVDLYLEQVNRGLPASRNAGFRAARGRFVVPLDADDLIRPDYVSTCLAALQQDSEAAFAYTDYQVFGSRSYIEHTKEYNFYTLLDRNFLTYAALLRKEEWERAGGYDESMRRGYEDWEFWLRLGSRGRFGRRVPKTLFRYRKHRSSLFDIALTYHDELVAHIHKRHPELYDYSAHSRIKAQWSPAVRIFADRPPSVQTIEDVQVASLDETSSLAARSPAAAVVVSPAGDLDSESAELAALAVWAGQRSLRLPDGSTALSRYAVPRLQRAARPRSVPERKDVHTDSTAPLRGNLHRHLFNAGLLSRESWLNHPIRSAARLIPLRAKERINRVFGRSVFDLSFYLQFQPNSLAFQDGVVERLRYFPRHAAGRARIALVVPHLGPGGAESVLMDVASTLRRECFEVLLLATQSHDDRWLGRWKRHVDHVYDLARIIPSTRMAAAIATIVTNWDCQSMVVQNSLYGYVALPFVKRLAPATRTVDVIHAIGQSWDPIAATFDVAQHIDLRVAVSGPVRDRLIASGRSAGAIRMLRCGVDLDRFRPAPVHSTRATKQILFAGRLDPVKRPLLLVDIASHSLSLRARDFRFVIAGDGPEMGALRKRVRQASLEDVFEFRGHVDNLPPLLADSDVVVLPSSAEGVPLIVLESMACCRPVVASNVGAIGELVDSECGVLIDMARGEAAVFGAAMHTLLNDPDMRGRMGMAGRQRVEAEYDLRVLREEYARIFD